MENLSVCEERLKKQTFLKKEILEKGYDALEFQEFLEKKKYDGGTNIDIWEFSELKQLVREFHSSKTTLFKLEDLEIINLNASNANSPKAVINKLEQYGNNLNNQLGSSKSIPSSEKEIIEQNSQNEIKKLYDILSNRTDYAKKISCRQVKENFINELNINNVEISGYEIQEGSIFSASYAIYTVTVRAFDWVVKRKISDFQWLADSLKKLHPCSLVPPLPKKTGISKTDRNYLEKKKKLLERFLNDVIKEPLFRNSQYLLDFLSKTQGELSDYKKTAVFDGKLEHLENLNGEVDLKINNELNGFHTKTTKYLNTTNNLYKEVQQLNKQLMLDFDQISSTLFEMGNVFAELYSQSLDYSNSVNGNQFQSLSDIYVNMNNFIVSWGNHFSGIMNNVQENLVVFFNYEKKYNTEMRTLESQRNQAAEEYFNLVNKFEHLAKEENSDSGIPLPNIIRTSLKSFRGKISPEMLENAMKVKDKFAYYNKQIFDEISKCLEEKFKRFSDNFIYFGKNQNVSIMELHVLLADLMCNFEETQPGQKKSLTIMKSNPSSRRSSVKSEKSMNTSFQGNKGEEFIFS